jgi:predicted esterase
VQGAAMALYSCYFKERQTLGGVIALSGYLPFANRAEQVRPQHFPNAKQNISQISRYFVFISFLECIC